MLPRWLIGPRERHRPAPAVWLGVAVIAALPGCPRGAAERTGEPRAAATRFEFHDVTSAAGIDFVHDHGGTGLRQFPETMGGGAAWFDADGDADLDLFFVQSGPLPDAAAANPATNRLYLNRGDGTFADGTAQCAAARSTGYGQGVTAGDADGDGDVDLFVTCFGSNVLLANRGDASFDDVTKRAGLEDDRWSSSAAFFDMDGDGDLDLYVVNYLQFDLEMYKSMTKDGRGFRMYPHPDRFRSSPDALYRNEGDGRFIDVTAAAGIADIDGKGLGVAPVDLDQDGDTDLYVANDSTPNFVFRNRGDGTFEDVTTSSNAGYNVDGQTEAGMGIAVGDVDGDLRPDLFVTNLDGETNTLYFNRSEHGELYFEDVTRQQGLALDSLIYVGFGTGFFDADLDGDLDLLVGNGHILDNVERVDPGAGSRYRQRCLFFENRGAGSFRELADEIAASLSVPRVVRAAAFADYDDDGDVDVVLVQNNGPAVLLRNDCERRGHYLRVRPQDGSGRPALGVRCRVTAGGKTSLWFSAAASSYLASNDPRILVGTTASVIEQLEIVWPTGERVRLTDVAVDGEIVVAPNK